MMKKSLDKLTFDNSFARLPEIFFTRHQTSPLKQQHLVHFNHALADEIELDPKLDDEEKFLHQITSSQAVKAYTALAQCYAGHQFGHFVPRLGDGRAMLLGEIITSKNERWDLQLKGGGVTEYSRGGDGRAVLRSTIREYLCSEAMHGLGIPTSRALCMIGSKEEVYREQIETAAILVRMAKSHIRFGSFEYYYYSNKHAELKILADYVLHTHFPLLTKENNPYLALLNNVINSSASLIAQWQSVGFCHGVMNTDNMSIHGLTIDYGPYGFLDQFNKDFVCNHSDHEGRYSYKKQPQVGLFNVSCFAQALLPLINEDANKAAELATQALGEYQNSYTQSYADIMREKLGLVSAQKIDQVLCNELLDLMHEQKIDYTLFFRTFSEEEQIKSRNLFLHREKFDSWFEKYRIRLAEDNISDIERSRQQKKVNPKYILRNYMAEQAIQKAQQLDYSELNKLFEILKDPYAELPQYEEYTGYPPDWAEKISVSCSS